MFLNKNCQHSNLRNIGSIKNDNAKCECFHDNYSYYTRSFLKPKGRIQFLDKKDGELFVLESRPKKLRDSWQSRSASNPDFFDPLHKANLCFFVYINESDGDEGELLKIRPMKLLYHLDDETISLNEPYTKNSGYIQGRIFHRQKVPRGNNPIGLDALTWKDLHLGEDIKLFGRRYRIVSCDEFTKNFLRDRGVEIPSEIEQVPIDSWNMNRHFGTRIESNIEQLENLHINEDADYRSWENMPNYMIFHAAWLDAKTDFNGVGLKRTFRLVVCTSDDTVTVTETTPGFNNALFLRSSLLPYRTKDGYSRNYRSQNFRPGSWIEVFKRPMFIYDCEGQSTINFIRQQYGDIEFGNCPITLLEAGPPPDQAELRPSQLAEFPKIKFLLIYNLNAQQIDICEMGVRPWTKNRPFLNSVDASHIDEKKLEVGSTLSLYRWTFELKEAHPITQKYLNQSIENVTEKNISAKK